MAVVDGTITSVSMFETPGGPAVNGSGVAVQSCVIGATFAGTYAQANDAEILAVPTAIQNVRRDGKTVTLLSAMFEAPGDEAGTVIGAGPAVTVSTADLTFQLTGSDLSTEHAGALLGTMTKPILFRVSYTLA